MRLLVTTLALSLVALSCEKPTEVRREAKIVLVAAPVGSMTTYQRPRLVGSVRNDGNATAYNCMIEFSAYKGNTIIDVASGFPAQLSDIPVGVSASFEAVFFNLTAHSQYDRYTTSITFLTK